MTAALLTVAKAPCKSCPYRCDVPAGLWAAEEYAKLPGYDGTFGEQIDAGAVGVFLCHQQDGKLCAGWVATHRAENLLAACLGSRQIAAEVWSYESPVPVFGSGAQAARHGLSGVAAPDAEARRAIARLARQAARRALTKGAE